MGILSSNRMTNEMNEGSDTVEKKKNEQDKQNLPEKYELTVPKKVITQTWEMLHRHYFEQIVKYSCRESI